MAKIFFEIYLIMFIMSIFMVSYYYYYVLLLLLSMEFLMLSTMMILSYMLLVNNLVILLLYYLIFVVCEGVLGLTLLVVMIRSVGNNNLKILNLILW